MWIVAQQTVPTAAPAATAGVCKYPLVTAPLSYQQPQLASVDAIHALSCPMYVHRSFVAVYFQFAVAAQTELNVVGLEMAAFRPLATTPLLN